MGSCVNKDNSVAKNKPKDNISNKKTDTTATNSQKNKIADNFGIKNNPSNKSLVFNHAPLRYSDFLFDKFKNSDSKPEEVSLGFMMNKCTIDIKNKQIQINYINSTAMKIWVIYGGIQKVSQTGLTVQIKGYKHIEQIRIQKSSLNTQQGSSLSPINLPQQPRQCILVVLQPFLQSNQSIFMIYRYQILQNQSSYSLISQILQWCSLSFRISDIYGSEYLFKCNDQNEVCSVCLTNKSQCILLPCRHMCICSNCLQFIQKTKPNCPLCRKQYYSVVKYQASAQ